MALIKVCTKSNQIPRRRRGGYEFGQAPRVVDVGPEAEDLIRNDDALIVLSIKGDDAEMSEELSVAIARVEHLSIALDKMTAQRDAAFSRLTENGIELGDLSAPHYVMEPSDDLGGDFGIAHQDRIRSSKKAAKAAR